MKWSDLLSLLQGLSIFESSMLLAGRDSPAEIGRQLTRWVASGRLIQLRRGLYVVADPFAAAPPDPLAVACHLRTPSYVSLQSALSYHGAIPESVPVVTSVTTRRPGRFETPLGDFLYRHVQRGMFWGYREVEVEGGQRAYVAEPEKALLDLIYLTPGESDEAFLGELRLAPGQVDSLLLQQYAKRTGKPKLIRAAEVMARIPAAEGTGEAAR